jgi:putative transcription factor
MKNQDLKQIFLVKKIKNVVYGPNPAGTATLRQLDSDDPNAPPIIEHNIKIKIQKGRVAKNLSQKQLAMMINVHTSTISSYESGKALPSKVILQKIKKVLGIKL